MEQTEKTKEVRMSISMINDRTLLPPQYQGRGVEDWRWKMAFGRLAPAGQSEELYDDTHVSTMDDGQMEKVQEAINKSI